MNIVITIQHPAHVHFFRNVICILREEGHSVHVLCLDKSITVDLLEEYQIEHTVLASQSSGVFGLAKLQAKYDFQLWKHARKLDPDVMTAVGGQAVSHVGEVVQSRSVIWTDTDDELGLADKLIVPFADEIYTPAKYHHDLGANHKRYAGYHELAYLHPNNFQPDDSVLERVGVSVDDPYFVLRFTTFDAHHDWNRSGLPPEIRQELVNRLSERGTVYVSAEDGNRFGGESIPVNPHEIHHLLAYADLFVNEAGTMATEAAVLGTPTIRASSFASEQYVDLSNFIELENKYSLMKSIGDPCDALDAAITISDDPNASQKWKKRRKDLLANKIDVSEFVKRILLNVS